MKAREGFVALTSALEGYQDVDDCKELVDWLLLSIIQATDTTGPSPRRPELDGVVADAQLLEHREGILHRHLPGLRGGPPTDLAATVARMAQATVRMADQQERARQEQTERANRDTRKTVKQWLGESATETLLRYTLSEQEADLPAVWLSLAQAGKQDRAALDSSLRASADALGKPEAAPHATADLLKKITKLEWGGSNQDDLAQGIHPFAILLEEGYMDPELLAAHAETLAAGDIYDTVMTGSTIGALDAQKLKKTKVVVPRLFGEAKAHLAAVSVVWVMMLKEGHPFALAYSAFVAELIALDFTFEMYLHNIPSSIPGVVLLLRAVQLKTVAYWKKARISRHGLPNPPDFLAILESIREQNLSWIPQFPKQYTSTNNDDNGGNNGGDANSTTTTSNGGGPPDRNGNTPVRHDVRPAFEPFREKIRNMRITEAIRIAGAMPKVTRGGQAPRAMCGAYHLKGSCWSNCERAYDHAPHSEDEDNKLVSWCRRAYA